MDVVEDKKGNEKAETKEAKEAIEGCESKEEKQGTKSLSKKKEESKKSQLPWVEAYRPKLLVDVVGNEECIERLRGFLVNDHLPNLLLCGPPGTGKTTAMTCLARELLGSAFTEATLELNASDERNVETVRKRITTFAGKKISLPSGKYKLVILDEADSMTKTAQQALRRVMETFKSTTKFAFACNHPSKIIEAIHSRCTTLRFARLSDIQVLKRIRTVLDLEKVSEWMPDGLTSLVHMSEGDLRVALNTMQATYAGTGMINAENVYTVADQPHPNILHKIIDHCEKGHFKLAVHELKPFLEQGYASVDLIEALFGMVKDGTTMDQALQLHFIREIGLDHRRVINGLGVSSIQIIGMVTLSFFCFMFPDDSCKSFFSVG